MNLENCYCEATEENYDRLIRDGFSSEGINGVRDWYWIFTCLKNEGLNTCGKEGVYIQRKKEIHLVNNKWEYKEAEQTLEDLGDMDGIHERLEDLKQAEFAKFGFEAPEGKLFKHLKLKLFFQDDYKNTYGTLEGMFRAWDKKGICTDMHNHLVEGLNLTPIKTFHTYYNKSENEFMILKPNDKLILNKDYWKLATNEEIDNLKCKG